MKKFISFKTNKYNFVLGKFMLNKKTVAVVVPCYNEEKQVSKVINTLPKFVVYHCC